MDRPLWQIGTVDDFLVHSSSFRRRGRAKGGYALHATPQSIALGKRLRDLYESGGEDPVDVLVKSLESGVDLSWTVALITGTLYDDEIEREPIERLCRVLEIEWEALITPETTPQSWQNSEVDNDA